jgi:hypothetical protein
MIDLKQLTQATVDTFRNIPEVMAIVEDPERIVAYLYQGPTQNKWQRAVYKSSAPSILVAWAETVANEGKNGWWKHRFEYVLRGVTGGSPLDLLTALINGVPEPGDGQRWRLCGFLDGLNPATILQVVRQSDEEGIDYLNVVVEILETGDA